MPAGVVAAGWGTLVASASDSVAGPRLAPHPKLEANPPPYVLLIPTPSETVSRRLLQ
ncbi:hypothetical protein MINTM019_53350 [Mycobacterium paraintracellulare]|nr:hypothetical protein MINTM011_50270 [Mycobacterium paraintracellulare]BCP07879.1 hypothetical protein MINTM019_53350 [Mycobacterium paraintracellulare]BCP13067.1 hypothetical protein MINTM020_51650 [Mycobacterium paraintracellulare]